MQTRQVQTLVALTGRVGSNPTFRTRRGGVTVSQCPAKASGLITRPGSNPGLAATKKEAFYV